MKRFRFSLHALWVLRGQQEELARRRFAESLRAVEQAAAAVRHARAALAQAAEAFQARAVAGACAAELQQERTWLQQLEEVLRRRIHSWQAACSASEAAREQWLQARRQREMLDRYHERQRHAWQQAWLRGEQKELDELARRRATGSGTGALGHLQTGSEP